MMATTGVSVFGVLMLLVLGLLVLGGLVAVVAMLVHPKTRVAGCALLAVGFLVLLFGGLALFAHKGRFVPVQQEQAQRQTQEALLRAQQAQQRAMQEVHFHQEQAQRQAQEALLRAQQAQRRAVQEVHWQTSEINGAEAALPESPGDGSGNLVETYQDPHEGVIEPYSPLPQAAAERQLVQEGAQATHVAVKRTATWFGLTMAVLGLLALGLLGAALVMLVRPRTRVAGAILLAVWLPVMLVGGLGVALVAPLAVSARPAVVMDYSVVGQPVLDSGAQTAIPVSASPEQPAEEASDTAAGTEASGDVSDDAAPAEMPAEAEGRPEWVDQGTGRVGGVYQWTLVTAPYPSREECQREMDRLVPEAIREYIMADLQKDPASAGRGSEMASRVTLPPAYVEQHIVKQVWLEPVNISLGQWVRLHALLQFDDEARLQIRKECDRAERQIEEQWARAGVMRRLCYAGTGLAAVLMLLAVLYGCLRIDTATGGTCRGRLCVGGGAVVLMIGALAMLAVAFVGGFSLAAHGLAADAVTVDPSLLGSADTYGEHAAVPAVLVHAKAWIIVLPIGLLLLGLATFKKTRVVGIVLLAASGCVALLLLAS